MSPQRWVALVASATRLEAGTTTAARECSHLLEVFGAELDPAEDFEASAVRQWLRALERATSPSSAPADRCCGPAT